MKSPETVKLIKDWLSFASENLLFAKAGMNEDFSPYHREDREICIEKYKLPI